MPERFGLNLNTPVVGSKAHGETTEGSLELTKEKKSTGATAGLDTVVKV